VLLPVVDVLLDLLPGRLFRKRLVVCGERLHYQGMREQQAVEIVEVQRGDGLSEEAGGGQAGDGVGHGFASILPVRAELRRPPEPDGRESPPLFLGGPVPGIRPYTIVAARTALAVVTGI